MLKEKQNGVGKRNRQVGGLPQGGTLQRRIVSGGRRGRSTSLDYEVKDCENANKFTATVLALVGFAGTGSKENRPV